MHDYPHKTRLIHLGFLSHQSTGTLHSPATAKTPGMLRIILPEMCEESIIATTTIRPAYHAHMAYITTLRLD